MFFFNACVGQCLFLDEIGSRVCGVNLRCSLAVGGVGSGLGSIFPASTEVLAPLDMGGARVALRQRIRDDAGQVP